MRILASIAVVVSAGMLLFKPIETSAHGKDTHGETVDTQMKKLNVMMPMFFIASAELETALEKGDSAAALVQADKIKAATADLKKSQPHKNVKQRKKFVEIATSFDEEITSTVALIKKVILPERKQPSKRLSSFATVVYYSGGNMLTFAGRKQ